jgi:hypothetical protein
VDSLVVSTTVWVIHRVHGNTANMREEFTTSLSLVVSSTCSSQRHLITAVTSEHTDGGSTSAWKFLKGTGWHSNTDFVAKLGFDNTGVSCRTGNFATVTWSKFDVVDGCSFRNFRKWCNVSRSQ